MKEFLEARKAWYASLTSATANTKAFEIEDFRNLLDKFCTARDFPTEGLRTQTRQTLGKEFLWRSEDLKFWSDLDHPIELTREDFLSKRKLLLEK